MRRLAVAPGALFRAGGRRAAHLRAHAAQVVLGVAPGGGPAVLPPALGGAPAVLAAAQAAPWSAVLLGEGSRAAARLTGAVGPSADGRMAARRALAGRCEAGPPAWASRLERVGRLARVGPQAGAGRQVAGAGRQAGVAGRQVAAEGPARWRRDCGVSIRQMTAACRECLLLLAVRRPARDREARAVRASPRLTASVAMPSVPGRDGPKRADRPELVGGGRPAMGEQPGAPAAAQELRVRVLRVRVLRGQVPAGLADSGREARRM